MVFAASEAVWSMVVMTRQYAFSSLCIPLSPNIPCARQQPVDNTCGGVFIFILFFQLSCGQEKFNMNIMGSAGTGKLGPLLYRLK